MVFDLVLKTACEARTQRPNGRLLDQIHGGRLEVGELRFREVIETQARGQARRAMLMASSPSALRPPSEALHRCVDERVG